jgi:beta-glucosidase
VSQTIFPNGFVWGAATAAFQIEGAANEDGRGESIWDRFSHTPGKVANGDTGDVACDHYHRWRDDIKLMTKLGLQAYRFSVAWPRVLPTGRGAVNQKGLDFYSQLVDGLLEAGIRPFGTLYHWDLPQALQDEGGWPARTTAETFAEYADVVTRKLGDRVESWAALNEPHVSAFVGYLWGRHAPGHRDLDEALATSHHLLLAHGLSVPIIRRNAPKAKVGIVLNLQPHVPASPSLADHKAAWLGDGMQNRWFLDPISGRGYPQDLVDHYGRPMDFVRAGDLEIIGAPLDYLGVNHYFRTIERSQEIPENENEPVTVHKNPDLTDIGWEVYPPGLFEILTRVHLSYYFPEYYITENGCALPDQRSADGAVHDPRRIAYIREYLRQAAMAIETGVPLKGYFAWSLLDNFEWAEGYSKRFGIVWVDYKTQGRVAKDSANFYAQVIRTNGAVLSEQPTS